MTLSPAGERVQGDLHPRAVDLGTLEQRAHLPRVQVVEGVADELFVNTGRFLDLQTPFDAFSAQVHAPRLADEFSVRDERRPVLGGKHAEQLDTNMMLAAALVVP